MGVAPLTGMPPPTVVSKHGHPSPPLPLLLPEPRRLAPFAGSVFRQAATCFCRWARLSRYFPPATLSGQIRLLGLRLFITRCSIIHLMHDRLGQLPARASHTQALPSLSLSLAPSFPFVSLSRFRQAFTCFKNFFGHFLPWQALPRPLAGGKGREKEKEKSLARSVTDPKCVRPGVSGYLVSGSATISIYNCQRPLT